MIPSVLPLRWGLENQTLPARPCRLMFTRRRTTVAVKFAEFSPVRFSVRMGEGRHWVSSTSHPRAIPGPNTDGLESFVDPDFSQPPFGGPHASFPGLHVAEEEIPIAG